VAWCLSLEDLFISKALAGRPKDLEFCRAIVEHEKLDFGLIRRLIGDMEAAEAKKELATSLLP
jgi:hypothetical protein